MLYFAAPFTLIEFSCFRHAATNNTCLTRLQNLLAWSESRSKTCQHPLLLSLWREESLHFALQSSLSPTSSYGVVQILPFLGHQQLQLTQQALPAWLICQNVQPKNLNKESFNKWFTTFRTASLDDQFLINFCHPCTFTECRKRINKHFNSLSIPVCSF